MVASVFFVQPQSPVATILKPDAADIDPINPELKTKPDNKVTITRYDNLHNVINTESTL